MFWNSKEFCSWTWITAQLCDRLGSASTFSASRFLRFFFFCPYLLTLGDKFYCYEQCMHSVCTHCAYTIHVLKNIKNGFHDTIYTFKYYFATVFSVFSFQFLVFSNNKFNPNTPYIGLCSFNCAIIIKILKLI